MASGKFSWRIENFSERQSERTIYSDVFTVGGFNWCIMLYPKGFNVDDCLSMYMKVATKERAINLNVEEQETNMASGKFSWRIDKFSERQSEIEIYSDVFTVGGCNWWILLYPKGDGVDDFLSIYLGVANNESLPSGWNIDAKYSFTVVNQLPDHASTKKEEDDHDEFKAEQSNWGWESFMSLTELHDISKGYLVNDSLVVEAEIEVLNVYPPTVMLDMFLSNVNKFITDIAQNSEGLNVNGGMKSEVPSLEEVEMAKKSLEECLSNIFKLNARDKLAKSLETLSQAEIGLSSEEKSAVQLFWSQFDDFVADFSIYEQENSEVELRKVAKDHMFHSIKKMQETQVKNKQRLDDLIKEEEEFKKRIEEAKSSLISNWQTLMKDSVAKKSEYSAQEKKLREAEERKRIAEERISRSTAALSSLKLHFSKA